MRNGMCYRDVLEQICALSKTDPRAFTLVSTVKRRGLRLGDLVQDYDLTQVPRDRCGSDRLCLLPRITQWDIKTQENVIPRLESCTPEGYKRLRILMSYIDNTTPRGELIVDAIHSVMKEDFDKVKATFYKDQPEAYFRARIEDYLRWKAIKLNLSRLVPQQSALDPLETLRSMKKESGEAILDFIRRYKSVALTLVTNKKVKVEEATHLLMTKMPSDFVMHMTNVDFKDLCIDLMENRARQAVDMIRLAGSRCRSAIPVAEYLDSSSLRSIMGVTTQTQSTMEIDVEEEECHTVRGRLLKDGRLQFPATIGTPNELMVAFKTLIKENDKCLEEAEKAVRIEKEKRANKSRRGDSSLHAAMKDLNLEDESVGSCHTMSVKEDRGKEVLPLLVCRHIQPIKKASMHVNLMINGIKVSALVDTGASDCFIQEALLTNLGLRDQMTPSQREVVFANGETDRVKGKIDLPIVVDDIPMQVDAFCIGGKGPSMILGFRFLEQHGFIVDCVKKMLVQRDSLQVQCHSTHAEDKTKESKKGIDLLERPTLS